MLKVHLVNKNIIFFLTSIILLSSCLNNDNKDIALLKVFFENYKNEHKKDSVFIGLNNYNGDIFKTYQRYLKSKKNNQEFDFPLNEIFLKQEYKNFKNQAVDSINTWDIDLNIFEGVFSKENYPDKDNFLYVSKPIYTIDEKYALIYCRNSIEDVYFTSSIEVYAKEENTWVKISKISHLF